MFMIWSWAVIKHLFEPTDIRKSPRVTAYMHTPFEFMLYLISACLDHTVNKCYFLCIE